MMYVKRLPLGAVNANCYILKDEKTGDGAVIDPGEYCEELEKEITLSDIKDLKYILCTHGHFDHVSGVKELKKNHPETKIAIGKNDGELLNSQQKSLAEHFGFFLPECTADILLSENDVVNIGETQLTVLDTPGHTPGGVSYICHKEKCVFTGDTLFKLTIGRTDRWGADLQTLLNSVEKLVKLPDDYTVYTGHNISTVIGDEKKRNRYLRMKK